MKKKNLIVHAIAVAIILATIVSFFIQEANFQKEAAEQDLHGFEALSLIPAMGIIVVFLEILFLRSLVVLILHDWMFRVEIVLHILFMLVSGAFLALILDETFFRIRKTLNELPYMDDVRKSYDSYGLWFLLGLLVIRFVYAMVVLLIKATREQRELDRDFLQQAK